MKHRILGIIVGTIFFISLPTIAYANSSWHWLTISPLKVLPWAILLTLIIETIVIVKFGRVSNVKKVLGVICLANLVSFLAPYLLRAYSHIPISGSYALLSAFEKGPYYIVLSGYLLLTIVVELPIVYRFLKENTINRKHLKSSILVANIVTTLLVAIIERILCVGQW
jgi:hypothetical protein